MHELIAQDHTVIQTTRDGRLRHLLSIEGLKKPMLEQLLETGKSLLPLTGQSVKKRPTLQGRLVANLFFENSTRTRSTFEIAAQRLSADVLNLDIATSSTKKGESLLDTLRNLEAMAADIFVVRHHQAGLANFFARHASPGVSVINAGDGRHAHPTQGLLDMLTIYMEKGEFHPLRVAIVGDILHSRVARSEIMALNILGVQEIRVIAPKTLLPTAVERLGVRVFHDMDAGLDGVDVIITLRLQNERMHSALLPSAREYFKLFGLTEARVARAAADAIVMHPGPINRGVEIDSDVADGMQSVILKQVSYGIAMRMAVLTMTAHSHQGGAI